MLCVRCELLLLFLLTSLDQVALLENGLARRPPMGWMSWGYYMCGVKCEHDTDKCLNEKLVMSVADAFYNEGYQEAGWEYIIIDDCWSEHTRDKYERLVPDKKRFPRGMKFLGDYIHSKGLKFGMYTNIAEQTCMLYPGSKDHFFVDAATFASWGVDYLKVDGCFVDEPYLDAAYKSFGESLNYTGRSMVYSCSWPYYKAFIFGKQPDIKLVSKYCNLWRNFHDVVSAWNPLLSIIQYFLHNYQVLAPNHGPGRWNDPDMLIIGTSALTDSQSRVQIGLYAMWSAPLLLSCDMAKVSPYEKQLLLNMDLLAIAQDALGIMAKPYTMTKHITMWVKPHQPMKGNKYPTYSFALVNVNQVDDETTVHPLSYGLNSTDPYTVYDVFARKPIRNITIQDVMQVKVPNNDIVLYTLYPL